MKTFFRFALTAVLMLSLAGCGYNEIQGMDEEVKAAWAEVENQFQRRYDLIPNLVNTVKGYAAHEKETLEAVTNARAQVGKMKITPDMLTDAAKFKQYQAAQNALSEGLGRLMLVAERYPDLKASDNFRDLQAQLEGTENRIAVARKRYIDAVKVFNQKVRFFPTNITAKYILHMDVKQTFSVENEAVKQVPKVEF